MTTQMTRVSHFERIIGSTGGLAEVFVQLQRVLGQPVHILLEGESDTGKEVVARALHEGDPRRRKRPFVPINCAAIPESLVETELFGFCQGTFTSASKTRAGCFQQADGGTLFLDEIGELPISMQPKLLRVLQERAVRRLGAAQERRIDVRVVAATNKKTWAGYGYRPVPPESLLPPRRVPDHLAALTPAPTGYRTPGTPLLAAISPDL